MLMKHRFFFIVMVFFFLASGVCFSDEDVINGMPLVEGSDEDAHIGRRDLDEYEKEAFRLLIVKKDGDYFWESNEGKRLIHKKTRGTDYFIDPEGSGFVKVIGGSDGVAYMEHKHEATKQATYWGTAEHFDP